MTTSPPATLWTSRSRQPGYAVQVTRDRYAFAHEYGRIVSRDEDAALVQYADETTEVVPYDRLQTATLVYVHSVRHAGTSRAGNPKYEVNVAVWPTREWRSLHTETDGSVGYDAPNFRGTRHSGPTIAAARLERGEIVDLRPLPGHALDA